MRNALIATKPPEKRLSGCPRSIIRVLVTFIGVMLPLSAVHFLPAQAQTLFTMAKVQVDVTAKDAVTAKEEAIAQGEVIALERLYMRLSPFHQRASLPKVNSESAEDALDGMAVRQERNSAVRYIATLDFTFRPDVVRQTLRSAGITMIESPASQIAVIPVVNTAGKGTLTPRSWGTAWNMVDNVNGLTPARIELAQSATDANIASALAGNPEGFAALITKYDTRRLVLAAVEPIAQGQKLRLTLKGADAVGDFEEQQDLPVQEGGLAAVLSQAAQLAYGIIEGRWRETRPQALIGTAAYAPGQTHDGASGWQTGQGGWAAHDTGGPRSGSNRVAFIAIFSGLRQWQQMRAALTQVPGLSGLAVDGLSARRADVHLDYAGGVRALARELSGRGLVLENQGNLWQLRPGY